MKKTFKFLALSLLVAVGAVVLNAANGITPSVVDGQTFFEDNGVKYTILSINPNNHTGEVAISANAMDPSADAIPFPANGKFTKKIEGFHFNLNTVSIDVAQGDYEFTVTEIAPNAFNDLRKLESVTIPATVKRIGNDAFNNCGNLASVEFEDGSQLETIGNGCFGVSNLKTVDLSKCSKLDLLNSGLAFMPREGNGYGHVNNQLETVILPSHVDNIGTIFANCPKLKDLNLGDTKVTTLEPGALAGDVALKSLTFPAVAGKTLTIGDEALCGTSIEDLVINTDLTTPTQTTGLSPKSFAGIQLKNLTIGGRLLGAGSIPAHLFAEPCDNKCSQNSLQTLTFTGLIQAANAISTDAAVDANGNGLSALKTLSFAKINANGIQAGAFKSCGLASGNPGVAITFNGELGENAIGANAFQFTRLNGVTFEQDIMTAAIGQEAFANTPTNQTEVKVLFNGEIGAANAVGTKAFAGSGITEVVFDENISEAGAIAGEAFANTEKLGKISFNRSLTKTGAVAAEAFKKAGKTSGAVLYVETISAPEAINSSAFSEAKIYSAEYNHIEATSAIAPSQFAGIETLTALTINNGLNYEDVIGASAFSGTTKLGNITINGDITKANAIMGTADAAPFAGAGKNVATTLNLRNVDVIVAGAIGQYAFANSGINTIQLKDAASNIAEGAFVRNSFLDIPQNAKIYYSPAVADIQGCTFHQFAFTDDAPVPVDIKFYTNPAVKNAYEVIPDRTPWRIKMIMGIDIDLSVKSEFEDNYYAVWAPQDEMYIIDKYQQDATITVYSAYFDDKSLNLETIDDRNTYYYDNVLYLNPLRVQDDGKYVLNAREALLIKSNKPLTSVIASQNIKDDTMEPIYQFGGIQTFAGLNVRQCNDFRYAPWYIYQAAYENDLKDAYGNQLNDYQIIRMGKVSQLPAFGHAFNVPADKLYVLATNDLSKRGSYSGAYEKSWIAKYKALLKLLEQAGDANDNLDDVIAGIKEDIEEMLDMLGEDPEENAELQEEIDALKDALETLLSANDDDFALMQNLITTRNLLKKAFDELKAAKCENPFGEKFAENADVKAAKEALDQAEKDVKDARDRMKAFMLGVIYLAAEQAAADVADMKKAQAAYDLAFKTWQAAHAAYIKEVATIETKLYDTFTQDMKDRVVEISGENLPFNAYYVIDADGNQKLVVLQNGKYYEPGTTTGTLGDEYELAEGETVEPVQDPILFCTENSEPIFANVLFPWKTVIAEDETVFENTDEAKTQLILMPAKDDEGTKYVDRFFYNEEVTVPAAEEGAEPTKETKTTEAFFDLTTMVPVQKKVTVDVKKEGKFFILYRKTDGNTTNYIVKGEGENEKWCIIEPTDEEGVWSVKEELTAAPDPVPAYVMVQDEMDVTFDGETVVSLPVYVAPEAIAPEWGGDIVKTEDGEYYLTQGVATATIGDADVVDLSEATPIVDKAEKKIQTKVNVITTPEETTEGPIYTYTNPADEDDITYWFIVGFDYYQIEPDGDGWKFVEENDDKVVFAADPDDLKPYSQLTDDNTNWNIAVIDEYDNVTYWTSPIYTDEDGNNYLKIDGFYYSLTDFIYNDDDNQYEISEGELNNGTSPKEENDFVISTELVTTEEVIESLGLWADGNHNLVEINDDFYKITAVQGRDGIYAKNENPSTDFDPEMVEEQEVATIGSDQDAVEYALYTFNGDNESIIGVSAEGSKWMNGDAEEGYIAGDEYDFDEIFSASEIQLEETATWFEAEEFGLFAGNVIQIGEAKFETVVAPTSEGANWSEGEAYELADGEELDIVQKTETIDEVEYPLYTESDKRQEWCLDADATIYAQKATLTPNTEDGIVFYTFDEGVKFTATEDDLDQAQDIDKICYEQWSTEDGDKVYKDEDGVFYTRTGSEEDGYEFTEIENVVVATNYDIVKVEVPVLDEETGDPVLDEETGEPVMEEVYDITEAQLAALAKNLCKAAKVWACAAAKLNALETEEDEDDSSYEEDYNTKQAAAEALDDAADILWNKVPDGVAALQAAANEARVAMNEALADEDPTNDDAAVAADSEAETAYLEALAAYNAKILEAEAAHELADLAYEAWMGHMISKGNTAALAEYLPEIKEAILNNTEWVAPNGTPYNSSNVLVDAVLDPETQQLVGVTPDVEKEALLAYLAAQDALETADEETGLTLKQAYIAAALAAKKALIDQKIQALATAQQNYDTAVDNMEIRVNGSEFGARLINVVFNDRESDVTGIMEAVVAKNSNGEGNNAVYNLQGIRVKNAQKGIYIQNGQKVVVK